MLPRFHPLGLAALTWLTLTQPVPGLAQGRPQVAPLPVTAFLEIELACPSFGSGILEQVYRNVEDEFRLTVVTYESFVPVRLQGFSWHGADGAPEEGFDKDLRKFDWDKYARLIDRDSWDDDDLDGWATLLLVELAEPPFLQVCSSGDAGIQRRYEEFLRRNRADLAAAPGTPLYNEPDPTLEP